METKFNSQICTTREQSERLFALGLKIETADCYHWQETDRYGDGNRKWHCEILSEYNKDHNEYLYNVYGVDGSDEGFFIPAWSLHRLIEMMPTHIHRGEETFIREIRPISISYVPTTYEHHFFLFKEISNTYYDGIIATIEWLIKEGYFNKEYLV